MSRKQYSKELKLELVKKQGIYLDIPYENRYNST